MIWLFVRRFFSPCGDPQFFTWGAFDPDSLTGADAVAAFAAGSIRLLFIQFSLVTEAAFIIYENEPFFSGTSTVTVPCDSFSSSPCITANPGSVQFTRIDDGRGEIDLFDSFALTFDECWEDDTSGVDDELIDGAVNLIDILCGFDDSCRLVSFGFNMVQLQNLSVSDTNSNQPSGGTVVTASTMTISGSFFFSFF